MDGYESVRAASAAAGMIGEEVVRLLMHARSERAPATLPPALARGIDSAYAYELQRLHIDAVLAHFGGRVLGVKLAGGSLKSLAALGMDGPFRGPIFSAFTHDAPARLVRDDFFACLVETEIALLLGEDLGSKTDQATLRRAVSAVIPSIEIADSRFADFADITPAGVLADLAYAGAWIRGKPVSDWSHIDLAGLPVRLLSNGTEVRRGTGSIAFGDPLKALEIVAADMAKAGRKLQAGQIVSTGTYTHPWLARQGESLIADFGTLGQVCVTFD